jgi:hypothetical protein
VMEDEDEDEQDKFDALFNAVQNHAVCALRNAERANPFAPTILPHGQSYPTVHFGSPAPWLVGVPRQAARQALEDAITERMCAANIFSSELARPPGEALPVGTAPLPSRVQQMLRVTLEDPELMVEAFGGPVHGLGIAPRCLAVKYMSDHALSLFRCTKTISSRTVLVSYVPIDQSPPELVLLLNGLAAPHDAATDEVAIRNAIADRWYHKYGHLIAPFVDAVDGTNLALLTWVRTLRNKRWDYVNGNNVAAPYYTVYVNPPTTNPTRWNQFHALVASFAYNIPGYGFAASGKLLDCLVCHGADHNAKMCLHRAVVGWVGPSGAPWFKFFSSGPPLRNN